ncbi:MAG: GAF domain-containing protein [Candidatus Delongbacteria bacterium]|nr:GAF domain-containing protein [Candidatus Delongbacteria bacterium]MBN2835812.1 GAF domain-containing protein [Candidatus Delongbacteria bacterium]
MDNKNSKYERIYNQLESLLTKTKDPLPRMSTIIAVLHHKFSYYFWTGFYFIKDEKLIVGPYQGSLACQVLAKPHGVCWSAVIDRETVIVDDVEKFPGHIACDSRSKSEIVVPVFDRDNSLVAVLDVDSDKGSSFDETDKIWLEKICKMIYEVY